MERMTEDQGPTEGDLERWGAVASYLLLATIVALVFVYVSG